VTAECATSVDGSVVGVPNPLNPPNVSPAFSGTLPAGNYYIQIAWYDAATHTTLVSPEVQVQLTGTGELQVSPPSSGMPASAVGTNVYIGSVSGSESYQGTVVGAATYIQSVPLVTGAAEPATNNTLCQVIANDAGWPTGTGYQVSFTTPAGQTLPGYPTQWQLLGPGNTINLGNGLPQYNGIVTYPSPILASPYGHATQSISGPLSLGGYTLTAGAINGTGLATLSGGGIFSGTFTGNPTFASINFSTGFQLQGSYGAPGAVAQSTGTGTIWAPLAGLGGTPTIAVNSGAGAGASIILFPGSRDKIGGFQLTTGASPTATTNLLTLTFSSPFPTFVQCVISPGASISYAGYVYPYAQIAPTLSNFSVFTYATPQGGGALTGPQIYTWTYLCNGY
jgi:hypothetical protein